MSDEFVDFYEVLELPLDAERSDVRKRINEIYIEAQKNLDHRNFDKRVRYQQLFEITLPQARYILLDAGRRDDYDRLVQASRAPAGSAPAPAPAARTIQAQTTEMGQNAVGSVGASFKLEGKGLPGETPTIDALPDVAADPEQIAREREEMWNKWKSGLQGAMEREAAKEKVRPIETTATPLADRIEAVQGSAPANRLAAESALITPGAPPPATDSAAPRVQPRNDRTKVKFDFGAQGNSESEGGGQEAASGAETVNTHLTPEQTQQRRDNHRREIMKDELENTGVKGLIFGAGMVLLPGVIFMTVFMSTYYPPGKVSTLPIKSVALAWTLWLVVLGGFTYLGAHLLSKSLRRKHAMELSMLSYEELLRHKNKEI